MTHLFQLEIVQFSQAVMIFCSGYVRKYIFLGVFVAYRLLPRHEGRITGKERPKAFLFSLRNLGSATRGTRKTWKSAVVAL